jgi:hypothetical protein
MTNNKQQTAVEWLHEIAKQREPDKFDWQQAKEMEKQRTISFALLCMLSKQDVHINLRNDLVKKYNELYGGKDGK